MLRDLIQDLRYAGRTMLKSPVFTGIALLTLALGIGANTAIFSVVDKVLLEPLPFREPDRLVVAWGSQKGRPQIPFSQPNAMDLRDQNRTLEGVGIWTLSRGNLVGGGDPEQVQVAIVSSNLLSLLGVAPAAGRAFTPTEDAPGGPRVALIGEGLWKRRFGSDPAAVGRTLTIDGAAHEVVGVLPAGFVFPAFPGRTEVWVPLGQDPFVQRKYARGVNGNGVIARLKPGVSLQSAQADAETIAGRIATAHPDVAEGLKIRLVPLGEQAVRGSRRSLLLLFGSVGFVLLIACANVANLIVAQATARQREMAIRGALGAGRSRIVRQLLTENVLLSFLGAAAGVLVAFWGIDVLAALPQDPPDFFTPFAASREGIAIDARVLAFTFAVALLTGLGFGLVVALRLSRPRESLHEGGARIMGPRHGRGRNLLVVSEVALSLVLMIGAGLMVESFRRLQRVDPGFEPGSVVTMGLSLPKAKYRQEHEIAAFYERLLDRIRALPGVEAAGAVEYLPLSGLDGDTHVLVEGAPAEAPGAETRAHYRDATPDYFRAMGIPVLRGRAFSAHDVQGAARVAVVNQSLADRFWPGQDPLGKRLALNFEAMRFRPDGPPIPDLPAGLREVVGVVADVKHSRLDARTEPEMYVPLAQRPSPDMTVVVRAATDPAALTAALRGEVAALDKDQPISMVTPLSRVVSASVAEPRFNVLLLSAFALVALTMAVLGVYGVMSYTVSTRIQEIGVRMALGARTQDILRLIVGEGMVLALCGVGAGLAGAAGLTRLLSGLLYGVSPLDPVVFTATALLVVLAALAACALPARRAARLDPMNALRSE